MYGLLYVNYTSIELFNQIYLDSKHKLSQLGSENVNRLSIHQKAQPHLAPEDEEILSRITNHQ